MIIPAFGLPCPRLSVILFLTCVSVGIDLNIATGQEERPDSSKSIVTVRPETDAKATLDSVTASLLTLESAPRLGREFDRVFEFHVRNETLDQLTQGYLDRTKANPKDGVAWTILGLIETQNGRDVAAIDAYSQALVAAPQDAWPAFYRGQSLARLGQLAQAVESFEQAIRLTQDASALAEFYLALIQVQFRSQQTPAALRACEQLERHCPDNVQVLERIVDILVENGREEPALKRYEKLIQLADNDERKAAYQFEAADLKFKNRAVGAAFRELEKLSEPSQLNGWLGAEADFRAESLAIRLNTYDSQIDYLKKKWMKSPSHLDLIRRLVRVLVREGRVDEAIHWLERTIEMSPKQVDVRRLLIDVFVSNQRVTEALQQYELLDQLQPDTVEVIRDWGSLILRDSSRTQPERLAAAEKVWRRLLLKQTDPAVALQVADLFRRSDLTQPALEAYQLAVALAPDQALYLSALGEFQFQLSKPEAALTTWRKIAVGKQRTVPNLSRLAEILMSYGFQDESTTEIQAAAHLAPKDFSMQLQSAELLIQAKQYTSALVALLRAEKLAKDPSESEYVATRQFAVYQLENSLGWREAKLIEDLKGPTPTAKQWLLLARFQEVKLQFTQASASIDAAQKLEPKSLPALQAAVRVAEKSGHLKTAVELMHQLAESDTVNRIAHLKHILALEIELGRVTEALQVGQTLAALPAVNTLDLDFIARAFAQVNQPDAELQILKTLLSLKPNEPQRATAVGQALLKQKRTAAAFEYFWQALEKTSHADDQVKLVQMLTELSQQLGRAQLFINRLERTKHADPNKHGTSIALSLAYQAAGQYGRARRELQRLLTGKAQDIPVLELLARQAATDGDFQSSIHYSRIAIQLAPTPEREYSLAILLARDDENEESVSIVTRLLSSEYTEQLFLNGIDLLSALGEQPRVIQLLDAKLHQIPDNWQWLYRRGVALAIRDPKSAARDFRSILESSTAQDFWNVFVNPQVSQPVHQSRLANNATEESRQLAQINSLFGLVPIIRRASGLDHNINSEISGEHNWVPTDYEQARLAAFAWLYRFAKDQHQEAEFLDKFQTLVVAERASPSDLWNGLCVRMVGGNNATEASNSPENKTLIMQLARRGDPRGQQLYLAKVRSNAVNRQLQQVDAISTPEVDEMLLLRTAYYSILQRRLTYGEIHAMRPFAATLVAALTRAGRVEEARTLEFSVNSLTQQSNDPIDSAILSSDVVHDVSTLLAALEKLPNASAPKAPPSHMIQDQVARKLIESITIQSSERRERDCLQLLDYWMDRHLINSISGRMPNPVQVRQFNISQSPSAHSPSGPADQGTVTSYYFDPSSMAILYNTFTTFQKVDSVSDLSTHLTQKMAKSHGELKSVCQMSLAYIALWNGDAELALKFAIQASFMPATLTQGKLEVARFQMRAAQYDQALKTIDSITPVDQQSLWERETLAFEVAARSANTARVLDAASRLCTSEQPLSNQIAIIANLRQLSLEKQANAILAQARWQAASDLPSLAQLLTAYEAAGLTPAATEIAFQILRQSQSPRYTAITQRELIQPESNKSPRVITLQFLHSIGKLKELTGAIETHLKPPAEHLRRVNTLFECYDLTNQQQKALKLETTLLAAMPQNVALRLRHAQRLSRNGNAAKACDAYLQVIRIQPNLIGYDVYQVFDQFRRTNREVEFATAVGKADLKQFPNSQSLVYVVSTLFGRQPRPPIAMVLFKKMWDDLPDTRGDLLASAFNYSAGTNTSELSSYAKLALVPTENQVNADPWIGLSRIASVNAFGSANSILKWALDFAAQANELPQLRADVARQVTAIPQWKAGSLILATIDIRLGHVEQAKPVLQTAASKSLADFPLEARWIIGIELESRPELRSVLLPIYETLVQSNTSTRRYDEFNYGPQARLFALYVAMGRLDAAKQLLVTAEKQPFAVSYNPTYDAQRRSRQWLTVAQEYEKLNSVVDAARLYRRIIRSNSAMDQLGTPSQFDNDYEHRQAIARWNTLMKKMVGTPTLDISSFLLNANEAQHEPAIDLLLELQVDEESVPQLHCQLANYLAKRKITPKIVAAQLGRLRELAQQRPQDVSVPIAAAILALTGGDKYQIESTLTDLKSSVNHNLLPVVTTGKPLSIRQREIVQQQIALWIVAAGCLKDTQRQSMGEIFATRALDAAQLIGNDDYILAILHDRIRLAIRSGNQKTVETQLTQILNHVTGHRSTGPSNVINRPPTVYNASPDRENAGNGSNILPAPAAGLENEPPESAPNVGRQPQLRPLTLTQFRRVLLVADLAIEQGLSGLAARALRESMERGWPVSNATGTVTGAENSSFRLNAPSANAPLEDNESNAPAGIEKRLLRACKAWRNKGLANAELYAVLRELVFPKYAPGRIVLFKRPLNVWKEPNSLGLELVRLAATLQSADTLRNEIRARQTNADASLKGCVLLVQLAVALKDDAAAKGSLQQLAQLIPKRPTQDVAMSSAHAIGVALDHPELLNDVIPVLEAVEQVLMPTQSPQSDQAVQLLVRTYLQTQQLQQLQLLHTNLNNSRLNRYLNSNADWGLSRRRTDLANFAGLVATSGNLAATLEYLAPAADVPVKQTYGDSVNAFAAPLLSLTRHLRVAKPDAAYLLLRDWTFPSADRKSLRFVCANLPGTQVPNSFLPWNETAAETPLGVERPGVELVSNFSLLVELAKRSDQLTDLQIATETLVDAKVLHAESLALLVQIALADGSNPQKIASLIQTIKARIQSPNQAEFGLAAYADARNLDLQILEAAIDSEIPHELVRSLGKAILDENRSARQFGRISHAGWGAARVELRGLSPVEREQIMSPNLRLWHSDLPPTMSPNNGTPAWWVAHDGHVAHICSPGTDELYFRYPLTGTFEFSFDVHSYHFSEGEIGYGGLISAPQYWAHDVQIWSMGQQEALSRAETASVGDNWNRYSVRVSPESIRFYANGHLTFEELAPSHTSPWLHLTCLDHRRTVFRNFKFVGAPTIPREVEMIGEDRLEGWVAGPGESLQQWLTPREQARKQRETPNASPFVDLRQHDWYAEGDVLHGRRTPSAWEEAQGYLNYARPVQDGETVQYEFLYEPGKTLVHPTMGNLAFLLEPNGVRLHWLTRDQADSQYLSPSNVADEQQRRRSKEALLPFKIAEWNQLQISLNAGVVSLSLNGTPIFERPLEATNTRKFGLFHYRAQTEALVRRAVLSGKNWPQTLSRVELAHPLLPGSDESTALKHARHAIVREEELAGNAYQIVLEGRSLPAEQRFNLLRDWVLPGPSHPTLRMQLAYTPTDPTPATIASPMPPNVEPMTETQQQRGGEIIAPVLDLVELAVELNRAEELEVALQKIAAESLATPHQIAAFQALLAMARGDDTPAAASLKMLPEAIAKVDATSPIELRSPEILVVETALKRPALVKEARTIAELLPGTFKNYGDGERRLRMLRAKAIWLDSPATAELPRGMKPQFLTQWAPVSHPTAESRSKGFAPHTWSAEKGRASYSTGLSGDALYFQSPITGNFEVKLKRTTFGWREIYTLYGGVGIELNHDGQSVSRFVMGRWGETRIPVNIPNWGAEVNYHLVVQEGKYTAFANGKQVHTEQLTQHSDPWLQIRPTHPHFDGTVRNVQILGSPQIPDQLQLSAAPTLAAWQSDYYAETVDVPNAHWKKVNDEIIGSRYDNAPDSYRESVLQYHRPLLEEGEIEYEFYYEPGITEVHPALDRATFILTPTGLQLHYLTDGAYERSSQHPENAIPLPGSKTTIPLQPQAWNSLILKLAGDQVILTVNGEQLGTHNLPRSNQRNFGLFHYADSGTARVRNVVYRGNWPKQLPSVKNQELSE